LQTIGTLFLKKSIVAIDCLQTVSYLLGVSTTEEMKMNLGNRSFVAGQMVVSRTTREVGMILDLSALKARVRWSDGRVSVWMRADLRPL